MMSRNPGLLRARLWSTCLALSAGLAVAGCSGEGGLVPPGDVLAVGQVSPIMLVEPEAPSIAGPVAFSGPDDLSGPVQLVGPVDGPGPVDLAGPSEIALGPSAPDMPGQNVLAYPVSDGVDMTQMTAALPEGRVNQPVVTGIGTDSPQLASVPTFEQLEAVPSFEQLEAAGTPDAVRIEPVRQPVQAVQQPQVVEKKPSLLAGLLPRFSNPLSKPQWAGGMPASEKACRKNLKRLGVTYRDLPAIGNGGKCGIAHPVEVTHLSGGIEIKPAAKLNCQITDAFARWVKKELAPAARVRYVSGVRSIHQMSSYSCRTMNSKRGAKMSEHSKGNAIDIGKITLNNGQAIKVRKPGLFSFREKSLLNSIRADSCKYFTTVLGPGSDIHHRDHFHFDLRTRKSSYRHCD